MGTRSGLSDSDRAYVAAVIAADGEKIAPWVTDVCPECDARDPQDGDHVVIDGLVIVGCEGFWVIDPNAVGIDSPSWLDWRASNA